MARLLLRLLGTFQVTLDGRPVSGFESNKVRALLAYLAVEADRPHTRHQLAGLLWPEWPETAARRNLSHALLSLRQTLDDVHAVPPFLHITSQTLQIEPDGDTWLDVAAFEALLRGRPSVAQLTEAVELYCGAFLEGFSLKDSVAFDDWVLLTRERLMRLALTALAELTDWHVAHGEHRAACRYACRQLELEPWREEAHRQLMRSLALSGRRSEALAQYAACCRRLQADLGVEPTAETTALYAQIRAGQLDRLAPVASPAVDGARRPGFLAAAAPEAEAQPALVARRAEMGCLEDWLARALAGRGRVGFVVGGPGRGKTMLLHAFIRHAQAEHADLVVAMGHGNAHTGPGDPYLPFRQVLGMLTGDVEARWAAGALSRESCARLWLGLPHAVRAVLDQGPELVDTLIPGAPLLARCAQVPPDATGWRDRLAQLVERHSTSPPPAQLPQRALFEQTTRVLLAMADRAPLMLVLDDLQWADTGSVGLLFHLGRQLAGSRLLVLGAYRPADLGRRADGTVHPLEAVVNEFRLEYGQVELDLAHAANREFVDAFLDSEPNRLSAGFRDTLFRHTGGHAMFTVELVRGMEARGDLVRDATGRWIEGPRLDWDRLPPRIEAAIGEYLGRLPPTLHDLLATASVEGEEFTAEVVARAQGTDANEVRHALSGELSKQRRLVVAQSFQRLQPSGACLSRYRFRHYLFQNYLYRGMDEAERARQHEAVGRALEALYGERCSEIAGQLARHFEAAGMPDEAIGYLLEAGNQAARLSANREAAAHFGRGLALLASQPETAARRSLELGLQTGLGCALMALQGYAAPSVGQSLERARHLCLQMGDMRALMPVLYGLCAHYSLRAELATARDAAEQLVALGERTGDPMASLVAHSAMGNVLAHQGEFAPALAHFQPVMAAYDPEQHGALAAWLGQDVGVLSYGYASWPSMWALGYADQALQCAQKALDLARRLGHVLSLAHAMTYLTAVRLWRQEWATVQQESEAFLDLIRREGLVHWQALVMCGLGAALTEQGQTAVGAELVREGRALYSAIGNELAQPFLLSLEARARQLAGDCHQGLSAVDQALARADRTGERMVEAELHRLRGDLLHALGSDPADVEACYRQALSVAHRQQAKSWELRAAVSLARLWQRQGRPAPARRLLEEIYGWFSEGFDTADLREARSLLAELASDALVDAPQKTALAVQQIPQAPRCRGAANPTSGRH